MSNNKPRDVGLKQSLVTKKEETIDEDSARLFLKQRPRNNELKVKKEYLDIELLPPSTTYTLLKDIPIYEVTLKGASVVDTRFPVSRAFLSNVFGGNTQRVFPTLSKKNLRKMEDEGFALDQWACMTSALNPFLPTLPGVHGLFFALRELHDDLSPIEYWKLGVCRVFSFLDQSKWLYVGHYEFSYGKTLTPDDWKNLPLEVREDWIGAICSKNKRRRDKRIRIHLRNRPGHNRQFEAEEYLRLMNSKEDRTVTPEQVNEAFVRGEEAIIAWKMKCVNYEEEFQRKLTSEFPRWTPPVTEKSRRGRGSKVASGSENESDGPSGSRKPPAKRKGKKRVIDVSDGSDTDNNRRPKKIAKSEIRAEARETYQRIR
ncbi:hypothetical protein E1B28_008515 [Marasmius oreades]|uniref:DUF6697 domain-containing protein n=1 Tax=Marasmius oreades TaxID=181124 RepID=A0A9P7RYN9_9AGAR|nr:uncharacterized protein E1B28_008515 [Marasmius oreades]KAG7092142.1 hypothetical protein E1B28_008515 [Marasmius oreades]